MIGFLNLSEISVKKHSLMALVSHSSGNVSITDITMDLSRGPILIDRAIIEIRQKYQELPSDHKSGIIIPIFCLDSPSPSINSTASFVVRNLPGSLSNQISALQLENPIELHTKLTRIGAIGTTFVDITSERIVIIGNTQEAIEYLRLLCSRFYFGQLSPSTLSQRLQHLLSNYPKRRLSTTMFIGGFGTIFGFVSAFLLNKSFSDQPVPSEYVVASVVAMLAIIAFLVEEAFDNKLIAFSRRWTTHVRLAAWVVFLGFIILAPLGAFTFPSSETTIILLWFHAILISIICALSYLGQIYRGEGFSRKFTIFARLTAVFFICSPLYI